MKKFMFLFLAILLFIPINSNAYTVFIAVDPAVETEALLNVVVMDPNAAPNYTILDVGGSGGTFTFDGGTFTYDWSPSIVSIFPAPETPTALDVAAVPFFQTGVVFYYNLTSFVAPEYLLSLELGGVDSTAKYGLSKTFDFTTFTGGIPDLDGGSLYTISQVPLPSAIFLLAPGLLALFGLRRKLS